MGLKKRSLNNNSDKEIININNENEFQFHDEKDFFPKVALNSQEMTSDSDASTQEWLDEEDDEEDEEDDEDEEDVKEYESKRLRVLRKKKALPEIQAVYDSDTSDEETINTVGNIPMEWYEDFPHIGYDINGKKIMKPAQGDDLDKFLSNIDDKNAW